MNFDFFKGFWSSPRSRPNYDEDQFPPQTDVFGDEFHSFDSQHDNMFRHFEKQFEQIFKSFGFMDFNGPFGKFESEMLPPSSEAGQSLRDKMLKHPDSETGTGTLLEPNNPGFEKPSGWLKFGQTPQRDRDLDEDVSSNGIDALLKSRSPQMEIKKFEPHSHSSSSFFSSVTVMGPDGKVEQRFTRKDSQGNEETVVKRQLGDKSHNVTIRKDSTGTTEEETFVNMDDNNLNDFNKKWNTTTEIPRRPEQPAIYDSSSSSMYERLFRKFLPPHDK